jgi:hypothetical protein
MTKTITQLIGIPEFESENVACDKCPARATHRLGFEAGILDFCTHHFKEIEPILVFKAKAILTRTINE